MLRKSRKLAPFLLALLFVSGARRESDASENKMAVEFEGNRIFSSERLMKKLNLCLDAYADAPDEYQAREFEYCLQRVQKFLRSQGYLNSKVGAPQVRKSDGGLKVTVPVEEGALYRLGSIKIEGAKVFSPERLLETLNLKTGDVADGEALSEWLGEKIKKAYADEGYIQSEFEVEPDFKPALGRVNEGLVELKILISEGPRFFVRNVAFEGNRNVPDPVLHNALLIRADEPFSQQRLLDSVKNLNDLDLFEWVDKERDVDIRTDEEGQRLDIKIQVREKGKRAKG